MNTEDVIDFRERLERAEFELRRRSELFSGSESAYMTGKANGVALALDYLRSYPAEEKV